MNTTVTHALHRYKYMQMNGGCLFITALCVNLLLKNLFSQMDLFVIGKMKPMYKFYQISSSSY